MEKMNFILINCRIGFFHIEAAFGWNKLPDIDLVNADHHCMDFGLLTDTASNAVAAVVALLK